MDSMSVKEDIRAMLYFYKALGFESLPLNTAGRSGLRAEGKGRFEGSARSIRHTSPEPPGFTDRLPAGRHIPSLGKAAALDELRREIGDCRRCRLSKERKNVVFGEGHPDAALMFIGEAPGREEDVQARPFVGEAGKLLTRLIEKMGFRREDVYIGNIVKCRPPQNRDPEEDEMLTCSPFIDRQIEIISPRVIVSLGRVSAQTLIKTKVQITKLRGSFREYKGIPFMPTFHPAYLLRNPRDKWLVWEDVTKVLEKLK